MQVKLQSKFLRFRGSIKEYLVEIYIEELYRGTLVLTENELDSLARLLKAGRKVGGPGSTRIDPLD